MKNMLLSIIWLFSYVSTFSQEGPELKNFDDWQRESVFSESFDQKDNNWDFSADKLFANYENGQLMLTNTQGANSIKTTLASHSKTVGFDNSRNFEFQVEMTLSHSKKKFNGGGIYWGNDDKKLQFHIDRNQYVSIGDAHKLALPDVETISVEKITNVWMKTLSLANMNSYKAPEPILITMIKIGSDLHFYVNKTWLKTAYYSESGNGEIGLMLTSGTIIFDNVKFSYLKEKETFTPIVISKTNTELGPGINESYSNRYALVIGNNNYKTGPLKNAANDAESMSAVLRSLGWDVMLLKDLDRRAMITSIKEFGDKFGSEKSAALFFYAGHGLQYRGKNYLVPTDANIDEAYEIEHECLEADRVLSMLEYLGNDMNIIILDACRNNPYTRSFRSLDRGLAIPDNAPTGSIIAFSTAPGDVASDGEGQNGLYTQELIKALQTPNLTISQVFNQVRRNVIKLSGEKQVPWENSSLLNDFYFLK